MTDIINEHKRTSGNSNGVQFNSNNNNNPLSPIELPENSTLCEVTEKNKGTTHIANNDKDKCSDNDDDRQKEVEETREKKRQREPFFYCKLITKYPKTAFGITLSCHVFMLLVMGILYVSGYNILPIDFKSLPLYVNDNKYYLRGLSWDFRNQEDQIITRGASDLYVQPERTEVLETVVWLFQQSGGNVLTQQNLLAMKAAEDELYTVPNFQDKFCHADTNLTCFQLTSILRFFDGTFSAVDSAFNDPTFSNVSDVIYKASYYNETKIMLSNLIEIDADVTPSQSTASIVRTYMTVGNPLSGYNTTSDREPDQLKEVENFMKEDFVPIADRHFKDGVGSLNFVYNSETILQLHIIKLVFQDMSLVVGSFVFICIFMWIQTGSFWITGFAILSVITGFCSTNIVYRIPLDFRYFGIFHVLALFIILGIGADDVFVFFDTWKESSHHKYISLAHRLSDCYRRASLAMLYTSLTTAVAFIVSATSPFMVVSTFGVFAGTLVVVNYLSVIIYFPSVIVTYHLYFEKYKCCCCGTKPQENDDNKDQNQQQPTHSRRKNPIVRFFRGPYFRFITHKIIRWFIMAFYTILLAIFIYFASQLKPNEEQIKFLPENSNFGQFLDLRATAFNTGDLPLRIFIIFGLKEQDLSHCHRTDSTCFGDTVWDNKMDINDPINQQAIQDFCNNIRGLPTEKIEELYIKRNLVTGDLEVQCFLDDLEDFLQASTNLSSPYIPVNESHAVSLMDSRPLIYNASLLGANYSNWFELVSSYWLHNGFQSLSSVSEDFQSYNDLLGEAETSTTVLKELAPGVTYKYGTKLQYAAIVVNTTINPRITGYPKGIPIREKWETYISSEVLNLPQALQGAYQTTPWDYWSFNIWHWFEIQRLLSVNAVIGIVVGLSLASPILIIATMNIFVGLLATLTICCITVSVVGIIPMVGWKLGLLESLNLVLVVGLAVDYCVHLAEGYARSAHNDRKGRIQDALEEVGISIISGCCTTLGASMFLMFAQILFFKQFGAFMFCTIGFSILYALGFFTTALGLFGPENNVGSLTYLFSKCKSKISDKSKKKVTPLEVKAQDEKV